MTSTTSNETLKEHIERQTKETLKNEVTEKIKKPVKPKKEKVVYERPDKPKTPFVIFNKSRGKWFAQVKNYNVSKYLGTCAEYEDAVELRNKWILEEGEKYKLALEDGEVVFLPGYM